jgi:putative transport protein
VEWLTNALRHSPELALFLTLAMGHLIGQLRLGSFQLGSVVGTLIAGLVVGQFGIEISDAMTSAFFLMFMFATGFRNGPEFFRSLRSSAVVQVVLIILFCLTALAVTWSTARVLGFGRGTAAGLLAGAQTNSTALGSAASAASGLNLDPVARKKVAYDVAAAYGLTYVLGAILASWFLPNIGPRLMRVNLRDTCRDYELRSDSGIKTDSVNSTFGELTMRAYRLPPALVGQTVAEIENRWPSAQRVIIPLIRRADSVIDTRPATELRSGDVLVAAGRSAAFVADFNPLKEEVNDPALLNTPMVGADLVLTEKSLAGQSLRSVARQVGARGIFLAGLRRGGREMPFTPATIIERGDVLTVTGMRAEVERVADEVGYAVYPSSSTNLLLVAATIFVGGLVGIPAFAVGGIALSLSVPAGVLLASLLLGYLRSTNPRFGGIPDASGILLESVGLAAFVGCVGLKAGPGFVTALRDSGGSLALGALLVALVPPIVTILIGHYAAGFPPGILLGLCAGAGTSGPTLAALQKAADSKVPALGYGMACAMGNILMAVWARLFVVMGT